MPIEVVNPATGETVRTYDETPAEEVRAAVAAADAAQREWARVPFAGRAAALERAAGRLREGADPFARLMAEEMGKPVRDGRAEIEKCALACEHYAAHGAAMLADRPIATEAAESFVRYAPVGVVLAVMPWNFPFWQVLRFAAPALLAGNGALLKHASNVPGCALAIEDLLRAAGFPEGLFRALLVGSDRVAPLLADPRIRAVTLTGSDRAGRAVAAEAGGRIKKSVLELGGSDPYVILEDADLDLAVETCARSRLINSGQSCIAAKRFVVVEAVRDRFERGFVARMGAARMGDPLDEATEVGPQAREDLRDDLHDQVLRSVEAGARVLLGGEVPARAGSWYPPTVLTDVRPGMAAADEEVFGPVAAIVPVRDEEEALSVANASRFGLGAAVFTRDVARGRRIAADRLEAGSCFVNALVRSDPRLPFGGTKESGYGRELAEEGIREFVHAKTVVVGPW